VNVADMHTYWNRFATLPPGSSENRCKVIT
jgi:hypothetical protein